MIRPAWASNPDSPITVARQRIPRRYQQRHRGKPQCITVKLVKVCSRIAAVISEIIGHSRRHFSARFLWWHNQQTAQGLWSKHSTRADHSSIPSLSNNKLREVAWCLMSLIILLSHLRSLKVIQNYAREKGVYKILLVIHCRPKYVFVLYCYWHI